MKFVEFIETQGKFLTKLVNSKPLTDDNSSALSIIFITASLTLIYLSTIAKIGYHYLLKCV